MVEVDTTHRQTLSQIIMSPINSSKGSLISPKNHLLAPKRPALHPLIPLSY